MRSDFVFGSSWVFWDGASNGAVFGRIKSDMAAEVSLSVTFRYHDHIGWNTPKIIWRPNSTRPLLGLTPTWDIINGTPHKNKAVISQGWPLDTPNHYGTFSSKSSKCLAECHLYPSVPSSNSALTRQLGANTSTRGHSLKLNKNRVSSELRHHFLSERVINIWNSLDNRTVTSESLNIFKHNLERLHVRSSTTMGLFIGIWWCKTYWVLRPSRSGEASSGKHSGKQMNRDSINYVIRRNTWILFFVFEFVLGWFHSEVF